MVAGSYIEASPKQIIHEKPHFFGDFDLVIGTQLHLKEANELEKTCRQKNIPLVLIRSFGLMGLLKVR